MAEIQFNNNISSELTKILDHEGIQPGTDVGYELCKLLWQFHPLGGKLVEKPIEMAMCKPRQYNVATDPDERVVVQFRDTWERMGINEKIKNFFFVSRCYGAAAIGVGTMGAGCSTPLPKFGLQEDDVYINVWDPLNAAGSMVTDQNPNSPFFQEPKNTLKINGKSWHTSRTLKVFNGTPIYLEYQNSAFGFTGRSVFQRVLFPMKSFVGTMQADDLVSQKAGVLVAKIKQNGSIANGIMAAASKFKRDVVKMARNSGVINIGSEDDVESLNLQNIDKALTTSRDDIISNIATGSDVPAILLKEEAFSKGFSEGSEDSKAVSQYIDGVRQKIEPVMDFFEKMVRYIAWNEDFFNSLKNDFPDIITEDYQTTFYMWEREFTAEWQELIEESPDKRREADSKVVQQATALYTALSPTLDPENRAAVADWVAGIVNGTQTYGDFPLIIDIEALSKYQPPPPQDLNNGGQTNKPGEEEEET
ncbi:anti-CBASS protein Acb1 family protein [Buttiauxella sp. S19-1]|uniref:anti-CBASS protein Acb1 family protein n=1 Tax=Buttiauxella sp. S19-1 TaxID=941430 RepID=UPI001EDBEDC1|nr:anti-CBASS Acb1 family protein [Buttiauxella sp. S19-1]